MANGSDGAVLRQVNRLFGPGTVAGLSEGDLLERFVARRDEAAFEALVARHGPMVLGVCRRALRDPHDADDAFQATFLILARRAGAIRDREILARWLFGVARRVSARARVLAGRRRDRERPASEELAGPVIDPADGELRAILDEEVGRLPDRYRSPVVLCYLEGRSHEEAARQLGWPVGTVKGRLSRARALLRSRLTRRGLAGPAAALAMAAVREASAAVPEALLQSTTRTALTFALGGASAGMFPAASAALAEGTLRTTTMFKLKVLSAAVLAVGIAAGGAGVIAQVGKAGDEAPSVKAGDVQIPQTIPKGDDRSMIQGRWVILEIEVGGQDEQIPRINPTILVTDERIVSPVGVGVTTSPRGAPYLLIPSSTPKGIDFSLSELDDGLPDRNKVLLGIYSLDGDRLRFCIAGPDQPRPRAFVSNPDTQTRIVTLRRKRSESGEPAASLPVSASLPVGAKVLLIPPDDVKPGTTPARSTPLKLSTSPSDPPLASGAATYAPELEALLKHAQRSLQQKEELARSNAISRRELLEAVDVVETLQAKVRGTHQAMVDELEILQARLTAKDAELQKAEADVQLSKAVKGRLISISDRGPNFVSREETVKAEGQAELAEAQRNVKKAEAQEAAIRVNHAKRRVAELARLLDPKAPPTPDAPAAPAAPAAPDVPATPAAVRPGPADAPKADLEAKERAIRERLERPIDLTFEQATLEEAIKAILVATSGPDDGKIPIYVEPADLQAVDKTINSRINLAVRGATVATALRLLLGQLGLTYKVEDGLVKIVGKSVPRGGVDARSR